MRVDQLVVGGVAGDAIFNEARFLQTILRARGFASEIYAERVSPALPRGQALDARAYRPRPADTLIFHYSIGSALNALVRAWPMRLVLIYHNITPPEFFRGINPQIAAEAAQGRAELGSFKVQTILALADSEFNRLELATLGYGQTGVLPLSSTLPRRAVADEALCRSLQDGAVNLLFVGRVTPHKKQDDLLRLLYVYHQLNPRARLILVGSWGGTERYLAWLKSLAATLGVSERVVFAGHVTDSALLAYYQSARLFVCLSEHEGFGVPLIEAMALEVPVIAYNSTGVPYTLGGAGVLVHQKRWDVLAAVFEALVADGNFRRGVLAQQRERAQAFTPDAVRAQFERSLGAIGL